MDIKNMPLVDDLAQSIDAVKDHLPVQTATDLTGMMERSSRFNKLSKIGILAMGGTAVVSLILSGLAHYFAPSAGIAEFDAPRVLIETFSSSWQTGGGGGGMSQFDNVEGVLTGFIGSAGMKFLLLAGTVVGLAAAIVRQTIVPLMAVVMLGGATTMLPMLSLVSPTHDTQATRSPSPREQFEIAIREQDSATLRTFLTGSSPAVTYLKAQLAIKDGTLNLPSVGETAKAIALGKLGFVPNNQVAYAIESAAEVKQFSGPAKAYADPAMAKADLFLSLSHWVGIAAVMLGLPSVAVGLLHVAIRRRIRRIGQLSAYLVSH